MHQPRTPDTLSERCLSPGVVRTPAEHRAIPQRNLRPYLIGHAARIRGARHHALSLNVCVINKPIILRATCCAPIRKLLAHASYSRAYEWSLRTVRSKRMFGHSAQVRLTIQRTARMRPARRGYAAIDVFVPTLTLESRQATQRGRLGAMINSREMNIDIGASSR